TEPHQPGKQWERLGHTPEHVRVARRVGNGQGGQEAARIVNRQLPTGRDWFGHPRRDRRTESIPPQERRCGAPNWRPASWEPRSRSTVKAEECNSELSKVVAVARH